MSGFVMGGLLGAAAVMYFSRNNRSMNFAGMGNASQMVDGLVEKVRSRMMAEDKRMPASQQQASNSQASPNGSEGLQQVSSMIEKDPQLKSQVDEILKDSGSSQTTSSYM